VNNDFSLSALSPMRSSTPRSMRVIYWETDEHMHKILGSMLTISKPLSGGQARTHHAREFAAKEANYWSREQQAHSEWQGKLAQEWGLRASIDPEQFARLTVGQHPETQGTAGTASAGQDL
jgi:hypothetical protein